MSCTICLDTNVLQSLSSQPKEEKLRLFYEKNKNSPDFVFSNWTYILFIEKDLTISPLAVWETTANKMDRKPVNDTINFISYLIERFNTTQHIDPTTLAISYLFSAVTGIPCDDSYHFIHAVRSSANFFASSDKDFKSYEEDSKDEIINRMKELLSRHNAVMSISSAEILIEIERIAGLQWAKMIKDPTDIPTILET